MNAKPTVHPITGIRLPEAETSTLPSGLKFCRVHGGDADVVRLRVVWKGGERDCRIPQVARIASLMIPEASQGYPDGQAARALDFNGAGLGVTSTNHSTILTLTVLSSKLAAVLPVVADLIHHPAYGEKTFGVMRGIEAMRLATSMVDVDSRAAMLLSQVMAGKGHPAASAPTPSDVEAITFSEVTDFCRRTLGYASGAVAFLSGNFTDGNLSDAEEFLSSLPDCTEPPSQFTEFHPDVPGRYSVAVPDALQGGIRMGLPSIGPFHADFVALRESVTALGGYFGSRLMRNIREDKGYTYGIQSYILTGREGASVRVAVQTDVSTIDAVIGETRLEMRRLAENPPCGEELERLRQNLALELAAVVDTPFSVADEYMRVLTGLVPDNLFRLRSEALSVLSPETIADAAARYLSPDALRIAVATKE